MSALDEMIADYEATGDKDINANVLRDAREELATLRTAYTDGWNAALVAAIAEIVVDEEPSVAWARRVVGKIKELKRE